MNNQSINQGWCKKSWTVALNLWAFSAAAATGTQAPFTSQATCTGSPSNREVRPLASDIPLRTSPSESAPRVVNQSATEVFGRKEYANIDKSELLTETCTTSGWSHVQVKQPSHLNFIAGWVQSKNLRGRLTDEQGIEIFTQADFEWTKRTKPYASIIVAGVNKVLRENPRCKQVNTGSVDISSTKGSRENPVFYVTCDDSNGDPFNIFFSKADVNKGTALSGKHIEHAQAVNICEAAAKSKSTNPSTVKFSRTYSLAIVDFQNGRTSVRSKFTAANKLGSEGTYQIECMLTSSGLIDVTVREAQ